MSKIELVIMDMDNTLYNWVDYYIPSFRAMLDELHEITGIDKEILKHSFQRVHQRHNTSEYAFAVQELDVLTDDEPLTADEVFERYGSAITAFREVREKRLGLYDGVAHVLMSFILAEKRLWRILILDFSMRCSE